MKQKHYIIAKLRFFLILFFFFDTTYNLAYAQFEDDAPVGTYNLDACIQYAFDNLEEFKKAELNVLDAEAQIKETKAIGLPQITAEGQLINNFKIQKTILPDGTLFGGPPGPLGVEFQPRYTSQGNITVSQLLYNPSYQLGLQAAKTLRELTAKQVDVTKNDVAANVSKAYYSVLVSKARLELLEQNISRLDTLFKETQVLYENGFAEQIDVSRLEVTYNNLLIDKDNTEQFIELSVQLLKFQMGMPLTEPIMLEGSIEDIELDSTFFSQEELVAQMDYKIRPEYELLLQQRNLLEIDIKNKRRAGRYPQLAAFATYGANTGQTNFGEVFTPSNWFSYGLWGLNLTIPIFDSWSSKNSAARAMIAADQNQYDIRVFERAYNFEVEQAYTNLQANLKTLEARKENMELAAEVNRVARIKFDNGVGSNLEIIDAETTYKEAEIAYYNTLYEVIIAKIDLEKALGILVEF